MKKVLIVYATTDGHTLKICQRLKQLLEQQHQVEIRSVDVPGESLPHFDKIIIGASVRYGKHSPKIVQFIKRHQIQIESRPNAFFSVNLVARKAEKSQPDTNPYVKKLLKTISWRPQHIAIFAGKLDYPRYSFSDRLLIRLIMWITKGPTDPNTVAEYTDWNKVDGFGRLINAI